GTTSGIRLAADQPLMQEYYFVPIVTDIRFGRWDAALTEKLPSPRLKLTASVFHYARGFAYANKHDLKDAARERAALAAMLAKNEFSAIDRAGVPGTAMAKLGLAL